MNHPGAHTGAQLQLECGWESCLGTRNDGAFCGAPLPPRAPRHRPSPTVLLARTPAAATPRSRPTPPTKLAQGKLDADGDGPDAGDDGRLG